MDLKVRLNKVKRGMKAKSIARRFSNVVILVCTVMAVSLSMVSMLSSQRTATTSAALALEETAKVAAMSAANAIARRTQIVADAGDVFTEDGASEAKLERFRARVEANGFFDGGFADASGIDLASGSDIRSEAFFSSAAMTNEAYISSVYIPEGASDISNAYVYIASPVLSGGKLAGVAYAKSSIDFLQAIVNEITLDDGDAYMLDKDGMIAAAVDEARLIRRIGAAKQLEAGATSKGVKELAEIETCMVRGESGNGEYRPEGKVKTMMDSGGLIQGYAPVGDTDGWSIAVAAPAKLFLGEVKYTIIMICVIALVLAVATEFVVKGITLRIVKPIVLCADRMESLANGDLTTPAPVIRTNDETKRLANSMEVLVKEYSDIIKDIVTVCGALAAKDLTIRPKAEYVGDFTPIEKSLNHIVDTLDMVMTQINIASNEVDMGSEGIAESAQILAETSTEQSLLITELTSTMRNISERAGENAQSATTASTETKRAGRSVKGAAASMEGMMRAIKEINDKSTEINAIIKTIEDIAFQTNILALNASVEAARAGEAGQGFVVVADEVRQLAERSSTAAKDTTQLIEDTLDAVAKGDRIVKETAEAMESVFENTRNIEKIAAAISHSSEEQLTVVSGATLSVEQISDAVTQIAASSEESAATSRQLSDQSHRLEVLVKAFRLARSLKATKEE